jgi:hypothetical protein
MLGKSLASVGMPELQKAVMGMDPRIKPFEALAELQTRVKREKMKQSMQAQNPQQQPVAQQALAEAASLQNPYMSGLGGAPVESPVGMAGGGIVAFQEGGDVPGFADGVYVGPEMFNKLPTGSFGAPQEGSGVDQPWAQRKMDELAAKVRAGTATPQERAWISMFGGDALQRVGARETQATYKNAPDQLGGETARLQNFAKTAEQKDMPSIASKGDTKGEAKVGLAAAAQGAGGAGAGRSGAGLGATPAAYDTGFTPQSDEDRIAAMQKYKKAMGAQNEEFLKPLSERLSKYESEVEEGKKGAMADALVQAGLGMLAGKSQYALQNIGEGGAAGLAALRESKKADRAAQEKLLTAQGDMAKSRIALEKGDEQTAAQLANQARQEQQAGAQFNLLGQHYANQDRAAQLQAQAYLARANSLGGAGGSDKHLAVLTRVRGLLNQDPQYKEAAKMANMPGAMGDKARQNMQDMETKLYRQLAPELLTGAQGNTMPTGGQGLAEADLALINKYMR